ncbi:hypothetical protein KNV05_gp088 [Vibrio phage River4]|uniref:Uncharacterized protein n=1 Tax=Vibrio phage River4 TaxID=2736288 RepID=A0A6M9Z1T3_9CAUD|nr:hypothetical protein KNV05_gp088 [Vibrio phage River4]QKN84750.1 hypothetical protein RIVER4_88 [Vibrio phage River4]
MAKATIKKEVTITLTLTQNEATFLRNMLQNPMCHPDEEEGTVSKMRHELFHALKQVDEPIHRMPRTSEDCIADMAEFK